MPGVISQLSEFQWPPFLFILLATTSGDFSFVNAHCVLNVDGFQHKSVDTWCDETVSWLK
jgi:hypothetical protein